MMGDPRFRGDDIRLMLSFFYKITRGVLLAACVILAVVFTSLAFPNYERTHWYKQIVATALAPPQKVITYFGRSMSDLWNHYIALTQAAKENDRISKELKSANMQLLQMDDVAKENLRLRETLNMAQSFKLDGIGASVIAANPMGEYKTATIDRGFKNGIRKNMAVIGAGGLVGRVGQVSNGQATILLISDPNSSVDVFVQRTGARALLVGTTVGADVRPFWSLSRLEYLRHTSDVVEGDVVTTSGLDQLFPRGIPVGTIQKVEGSPSGIFKNADVVPFVDLSQMKEVVVLSQIDQK
jgi:rod shape-determining protein MreC